MSSTVRSGLRIASIMLSRLTAPVEVREQLTCQAWTTLTAPWSAQVDEWAVLTTCHRFELYFVAEENQIDAVCVQLKRILTEVVASTGTENVTENCTDIDTEAWIREHDPWIVLTDGAVAEHLCRVAAGLDSLVLGEAQIQGQVIATYTAGVATGAIGAFLSNLFRTAIRVGKRARTETQISTRAASMSSLALSMAARYFADFSQCRVLVIGAGEMSRLALKALLQRNVKDVTVANRTLARAEAVLMHPHWRTLSIDAAVAHFEEFDVVFSATSAPDFVVTYHQVAAVEPRVAVLADPVGINGASSAPTVRQRVLIDLAMPRDIEPAVRALPGIALVDVDDLRQGVDGSLERRKQAMPAVNQIIAGELERWQAQQRELALKPYVLALRQNAERIRQQEVERTMRFLGPVDEATATHIQHLTRALVNKLLHSPTVHLKNLAHEGDAEERLLEICDLFGIETSVDTSVDTTDALENVAPHGKPLS